MNPAQQKFQTFILERVHDGKENEAKALLSESFQKQADRSFDQAYLQSFMPRMIALLKDEHIEEVQAIMQEFGSKFAKAKE